MSLRDRLIRFRLDGLALEVCRPAGAELELLEQAGPLRSTFVARLVTDGWAYANALRVLGEVVDSVEARASAPASKSEPVGKTALARPRSPAPSPLPTPGGGGASAEGRRSRVRLLGPVRVAADPTPAPVAPPPAPSGTRRLTLVPSGPPPMLLLGPGVRHDCVHEADCLGRTLASVLGAMSARAVHCPPKCSHLEKSTHEQRYADAIFGKAPGYSL